MFDIISYIIICYVIDEVERHPNVLVLLIFMIIKPNFNPTAN